MTGSVQHSPRFTPTARYSGGRWVGVTDVFINYLDRAPRAVEDLELLLVAAGCEIQEIHWARVPGAAPVPYGFVAAPSTLVYETLVAASLVPESCDEEYSKGGPAGSAVPWPTDGGGNCGDDRWH